MCTRRRLRNAGRYFLKNAEQLTQDEILRMFPDEEIAEAAGVLEMINQTHEQRVLYNARLKCQRGEEVRVLKAREDGLREGEAKGRQEGRQEGFLAGRIVLLQELLGIDRSTEKELAGYDETQLNELAERLQRQDRARGY